MEILKKKTMNRNYFIVAKACLDIIFIDLVLLKTFIFIKIMRLNIIHGHSKITYKSISETDTQKTEF